MKKIILAFLGFALITSCDDATDIIQPGELGPDQAFITIDDLETGILGVYSAAVTTSEIQFTARFTDESAVGSANGGGGVPLHSYTLNPNEGLASAIWVGNYNLILRANILLEAAESILPDDTVDGEQDTYDNAVAQALALRAYGHSRLLSYYGVDLSDGSSLGIPIVDFVPEPTFAPTRNTVAEVFEFIQNDLNAAEALFTASSVTSDDVFFISNDFVRSLRARMAAYSGDTSTMISAANSVLSGYTLPSTANPAVFRSIWSDVGGAGQNELIFKLDVTLNNGALSSIWNVNSSDIGGAPIFEMGRIIYDEFADREAMFGDIRPGIWIDETSLIVDDYANDPDPKQNDRLVVNKYPGDPGLAGLAGGLRNDIKVFRTVEMHFILAEAAVRNNVLTDAAAQIKIIRDARYTTSAPLPVYNNATEAWNDILLERKLELYGEGHRYIDIKRLGRIANQGYNRNETDCSLYQAPGCDLPPTDFRTQYLPIPRTELNGNRSIQQNPNY